MIKQVYNVKNVERPVMLAISKYCRENDITQANYLKTDRRIKDLIEK
jgi:DNA-binding protein Fis